jgi:hypothetical protein
MPKIEVVVRNVEFQGDRFILLKDALLKPETLQQGELALFIIENGKVWRHHEEVGDISEVIVLEEDIMSVDIADLLEAMFGELDEILKAQAG